LIHFCKNYLLELKIMAKKNKNKQKNKSKANSDVYHQPAEVKGNKSNMLKGLFAKAGIPLEKDLEDKLNSDQSEKLEGLIETLNQSLEANDQIKLDLEVKQQDLNKSIKDINTRKDKIDQDNALINTLRKDIERESSDLRKRQSNCTKTEIDLVEREANAQAGFVEQQQLSLDKMKDGFAKMQDQVTELEKHKLNLEVESITKNRQQQLDFKKHLEVQLAAEIDQLNNERAKFEQLQQQLKSDQIEVHELKTQFNIQLNKQKLLVQQVRSELTDEYHLKEQELTQEIESLNQYRERDLDKIKLLQQKVAGFGELEREAKLREFAQPNDMLSHLDRVEQELKDARTKLRGRSENELEDELEYYKELAEDKSDNLDRLKQDYEEVRAKNAKNILSVREKLELQKQNDVLELHNQTLKVSVDSLRMTLDDLIEKQQSQEAFSELLKMDRQYSEPNPAESIASLHEFTTDLQHRIARAEDTVLYYDIKDIRKFVAGLAMSKLHVFQGISGTGKTSLVKAFTKAVGGHVTTVPVQAGWRDRDDLVGHYNAFEKRYYEKECLQGLYRAHTKSFKNRFNIILLDEMNLSRPEQYFAEFLSALEMRDGEREIVLMDSSTSNAPKYFSEGRKIPLSNNTWFMGTANHDETTFEFADKTHDRAFMMELKLQHKPTSWKPKKVKRDPIDIESVKTLFSDAEETHAKEVAKLLNELRTSAFTKILEKDFGIGWGNRFEGQAHRFIAVYIACGGEGWEALEHLLITRVLRKGKVLGRFDISQNKLEKLNEALENLLSKDAYEAADILLTETEIKAEGVY